MWFIDRLANLVTGLGTEKDKSSFNRHALRLIDQQELESLYRSDWLARKIVDLIPFDMTRAWRNWQAEGPQIEALEREERRLRVRDRIACVMQRARLYGGAGIYIGTKDANPVEELRPELIRRGDVTFLHVFAQHHVRSGQTDLDPMSPFYGEPSFYEVTQASGRTVPIHRSRIVPFVGAALPDIQVSGSAIWGDPILQIVYDAVQNAASAPQHVAALLPELKTDIVSIPGLSDRLGSAEGTERVRKRFAQANLIRSMHNILLLEGGSDKQGEVWQQRQINFANFPELMRMFLEVAAGAGDYPVTRLLGQSPGGLNATGDADIRNYYDGLAARQTVDLGPRLDRLDECLIRSALGERPPEVHYSFAPLWQLNDTERAGIAEKKATTTKVYLDGGLVPDVVLERAVRNQLVEDGTYPGLEAAYADFEAGILLPDAPEEEDDADAGNVIPFRRAITDAKPRPLYVHRKVKNGAAILAWAEGQGFKTTLAASDLHVTIAYSRAPVDWMKAGESWSAEIKVGPGGPRLMERFGDATVLLFTASELRWRHDEIGQAGASWDHPEFQPHVTISYEAGEVDLSKIKPYQGVIVLGPEVFEEVNEGWKAKLDGDE